MNKLYFYLVFILLTSACEQGNVPDPVIYKESVDVFIQGDIREPEDSDFSPFSVVTGPFDDPDAFPEAYLFWQDDVAESELGPVLNMGAYAYPSSHPNFGFQFWLEGATPYEQLTKAEVETFFAVGNTFDFGQGPGKVDVLLRLPIGGPFTELEASKSSYLENPTGTLTITEVEDFIFEEHSINTPTSVKAKLIRCTIEGQIGRFDITASQLDNIPWPGFLTDEVVELAHVESVFMVEYQ